MLIFTVPMLSFTGAFVTLVWTSFSLRAAPDKLWSFPYRYCGSHPRLNRALGPAILSLFWLLITLGVYRITLLL